MSRLRGQWLPDDGDGPDAHPHLALPAGASGQWLDEEGEVAPGRSSRADSRPPPAEIAPEPPAESGRWLDDGPEAGAAAAAPARGKVLATPGWTGPATGLGVIVFIGCSLVAVTGNTNVAGALAVVPVLLWITYTIARRLAVVDGQPAIVPILVGGLCVKLMGTIVRYVVSHQVYGRSDATEYAVWGKFVATGLRNFEIVDIGRLRGTNFVRFLTGIVFAVTPGTILTGFVVFSFFSFVGTIFFWRAYRRAVSDTSDLTYLQLIVLLPSLVYWPASLGKDAWTMMGVGIASYGVACVLTNRTLMGWISVATGVMAIGAVRPHVGIPVFVGLLLAEILRKRGSQGGIRAIASIGFLVILGGGVMSAAGSFLGIEDWGKANVDQELDSVAARTSEGRAQFQPTPVNSPVQFPQAAVTVMFRPMPIEVRSPQEFVTALENLALLALTVMAGRKILRLLRRSRRQPFLLYCFGVLVVFIIEYSSFSNFALLARQRTQVMALFLVFLCLARTEPDPAEETQS